MTEDLKDKDKAKPQKFFFDKNNFNDDYVEEPPAPVFNEEELEQAKKAAFEEGREAALRDAARSREQALVELTEDMVSIFRTFLQEEEKRAALYERDVINLTLEVTSKLFPAFERKHGLDEVKNLIENALRSQKSASNIKVEVSSEVIDDLKVYFDEQIRPQLNTDATVNLQVKTGFGFSDCLISWDDGGAKRDASGISSEIMENLQHILAEMPQVSDNESNEPETQDASAVKQAAPSVQTPEHEAEPDHNQNNADDADPLTDDNPQSNETEKTHE